MYSVVMMMALSGGVETPAWFRRGCCGCWGGYRAAWGCYGCYGWYGGYGGYGWRGGYGHYGMVANPIPVFYGVVSNPTPAPRTGAYVDYPSGPISSGNSAPDQYVAYQDRGSSNQANRAIILVTVPAEARLTFNGWESTNHSSLRRFRSPPLEPGKQYAYTVRAEIVRDGQRLVQTHEVMVRAGQQTPVTIRFPSAVLGKAGN